MDQVISEINRSKDRYLSELMDFLKIPSISADSRHQSDCIRAAEYLCRQFRSLGIECDLHPTSGNPVVLGRYHAGDECATLLVYGHYDVQPPDPLELWNSPPFEPEIRDQKIYARGATDNKGQLFTHIKAFEALKTAGVPIPVNLIYLIEGEEEIASQTLEHFIRDHRDLLKCDAACISDTSQYQKGIPCICYGLRGIHGVEIRVENAKSDLHSGQFGGTIANPIEELCRIIARMKDENGVVQIPGFYEDVLPLEEEERRAFARLPWGDERYRDDLGCEVLYGEAGYTTIERKSARPTFEMNGIFGGYSGEGSKTVLPSWAGAKITMRLVANQSSQKIGGLFERYVKEIAPPTVRVTVTHQGGGDPVLIPKQSPYMRIAAEALEKGFRATPVFVREGGSIPVVSALTQLLEVDTMLVGFGLPDDNLHAPNEKFDLECFENGIKTAAWFLHLCGKQQGDG